MRIRSIVITFPETVEVSQQDQCRLDRVVGAICDRYEAVNMERTMWPFGQGYAMLKHPIALGDDEPIPFDYNTFHIECAERERHAEDRAFVRRHWAHDPEEMFQDIAEFHRAFALEYKGPPRQIDGDLAVFRAGFLAEELAEYVTTDTRMQDDIVLAVQRAWNAAAQLGTVPALEKKFDALIDLVYVALGTAYLHGFPFDLGWARVHAANMQKVRSASKTDGDQRGGSNDVVKPEGWVAPDLSDLVET